MSGLNRHVAVARPVARESVTAILRAARAVRKDDHRKFSCRVGIKNSHMHVFDTLRIVQDEVFNFGNSVRTRLQLVASRVTRSWNWSSGRRRERWRYLASRRRRGKSIRGQIPGAETSATCGTRDEICGNQTQSSD